MPNAFEPSKDELRRRMAGRTDEQLQAIMLSPPDEYTGDAINAARDEFHRRRMAVLEAVPQFAPTPAPATPPANQVGQLLEATPKRQSRWAMWIWPDTQDEQTARSIVLRGVWACIAIAVLTTAVALYAIASDQKVSGHYDGWALVDAALFSIIAWRMWKNSRIWSVIGVILMVMEMVDKVANAAATFNVITVLLFLAILHAARGTFALHKIRTEKAAQQETYSMG